MLKKLGKIGCCVGLSALSFMGPMKADALAAAEVEVTVTPDAYWSDKYFNQDGEEHTTSKDMVMSLTDTTGHVTDVQRWGTVKVLTGDYKLQTEGNEDYFTGGDCEVKITGKTKKVKDRLEVKPKYASEEIAIDTTKINTDVAPVENTVVGIYAKNTKTGNLLEDRYCEDNELIYKLELNEGNEYKGELNLWKGEFYLKTIEGYALDGGKIDINVDINDETGKAEYSKEVSVKFVYPEYEEVVVENEDIYGNPYYTIETQIKTDDETVEDEDVATESEVVVAVETEEGAVVADANEAPAPAPEVIMEAYPASEFDNGYVIETELEPEATIEGVAEPEVAVAPVTVPEVTEEPVEEVEQVEQEPVQEILDEYVEDEPIVEGNIEGNETVVDEIEPVEECNESTTDGVYDAIDALNRSIAESALTLVGTTDGWQCTEVATEALRLAGVENTLVLWPDQYADYYGYYTDAPTAGNLIYYDNGGDGLDHIAVYLGDDEAVHGNYDTADGAKTVISRANLSTAGTPQYIQVVPY